MSNSSESESQLKSIAFSFTKKVKQNTISLNNKLNIDLKTESIEDKDFVLSIDDKQIQSTAKKDEKKTFVIPLIVNNRYTRRQESDKPLKTQTNNGSENDEKEPKKEETLEELAKKELLSEANEWKDDTKREIKSSRVIDALIQNRVPEGFESDNNFDVSLRPIEPTLEDYQSIPVEEFGLAMLRGMGWKEGMGVGANAKQAFIPEEPKIRPKGLGLGAVIPVPKQIPKKSQDLKEEDLQPKKGSFVCIELGANKGSYGVIEDFDDDMSRITVKLTLKKESFKTPIALVRVVSKTEFQTEGKVINKRHFDEYKQNEEKSEKSDRKESKDLKHKSERHHKRSDSEIKYENSFEDKNRKHSSNNSWLLPNLRVRIVDKNYKNGKYYKEKVVIIDVLNGNKCLCKTSDEIVLDDISEGMLETVIPRQNDIKVMVLFGKYRKQLAFIVDKNKQQNEANVRLLADKSKVVSLSFDHFSEYVSH